jgi:hypothetical protein
MKNQYKRPTVVEERVRISGSLAQAKAEIQQLISKYGPDAQITLQNGQLVVSKETEI